MMDEDLEALQEADLDAHLDGFVVGDEHDANTDEVEGEGSQSQAIAGMSSTERRRMDMVLDAEEDREEVGELLADIGSVEESRFVSGGDVLGGAKKLVARVRRDLRRWLDVDADLADTALLKREDSASTLLSAKQQRKRLQYHERMRKKKQTMVSLRERVVFEALHAHDAVATVLLPALAACAHNYSIRVTLLKLLALLTPLFVGDVDTKLGSDFLKRSDDMAQRQVNSLTLAEKLAGVSPENLRILRGFKRQFAQNHAALGAIGASITEHLKLLRKLRSTSAAEERIERATQVLSLHMRLLSNVLEVPDGDNDSVTHDELLRALHETLVLDAAAEASVDLCGDPDENKVVLRFWHSLLLLEQPRNILESRVTVAARRRESAQLRQELRSERALLRATARRQGTRHSRFGGRVTLKVIGGAKAQLSDMRSALALREQKSRSANVTKTVELANKGQRDRRLKSTLRVQDEKTRVYSREEVRLAAVHGATLLLDRVFDTLVFSLLRDAGDEENDTEKTALRMRHNTLLWLLAFAIEFARVRFEAAQRSDDTTSFEGKSVKTALGPSTLVWLLKRIGEGLGQTGTHRTVDWKQLTPMVTTLQEMVMMLKVLTAHGDASNKALGQATLHEVMASHPDLLPKTLLRLLSAYEPSKAALTTLRRLTLSQAVLAQLLEKHSQSIVLQYTSKKKKKASSSKKKSKSKATKVAEEEGIIGGDDDDYDSLDLGLDNDDDEVSHTLEALDMQAFYSRFHRAPKAVLNVAMLLSEYKQNDAVLNKSVVWLLSQVCVRQHMEPLLHRVPVLMAADKVLHDKATSTNRERSDWAQVNGFCRHIVRTFFQRLRDDVFVAAEAMREMRASDVSDLQDRLAMRDMGITDSNTDSNDGMIGDDDDLPQKRPRSATRKRTPVAVIPDDDDFDSDEDEFDFDDAVLIGEDEVQPPPAKRRRTTRKQNKPKTTRVLSDDDGDLIDDADLAALEAELDGLE
ncbi:MAG: hypothetical protein MHM6MM_000145 [Cercozoa sp. M6MM]